MYKDIRRSTHKGSLYFYIWLFVMHRPSFNVVLDLVLRICGVPSSCLHGEVTAHKCSRQFPPFTGLPSLPQNNLSSTQADNGPIQHSLVYNFNFIVWKVASNPRIQIPRGGGGNGGAKFTQLFTQAFAHLSIRSSSIQSTGIPTVCSRASLHPGPLFDQQLH